MALGCKSVDSLLGFPMRKKPQVLLGFRFCESVLWSESSIWVLSPLFLGTCSTWQIHGKAEAAAQNRILLGEGNATLSSLSSWGKQIAESSYSTMPIMVLGDNVVTITNFENSLIPATPSLCSLVQQETWFSRAQLWEHEIAISDKSYRLWTAKSTGAFLSCWQTVPRIIGIIGKSLGAQ